MFAAEPVVATHWYEWMFHGNKDRAYDTLRGMKAYVAAQGIHLTVAPLPAGIAWHGQTYVLDAMYDDILGFLKAEGIPSLDLRKTLNQPAQFDPTDHLTAVGDTDLVKALASVVSGRPAPL